MTRYHFTTVMIVATPRERVWEVLSDPVAYADRWKWLRQVEVLEPGDATGVGARHRLWFRTALPYTMSLEMEVARVAPPTRLQTRSDGDLRGTGRWTLVEEDGGTTHVTYEWLVETTKRWMNLLAPIARPAFSWNHDVLMRDFARALASATDGELLEVSSTSTPPGARGFFELAPHRLRGRGGRHRGA